MDDVERLGEILDTATADGQSITSKYALPPQGAARLSGKDAENFYWEPISPAVWATLPAKERGEILVDRTVAWLDVNGRIKASPISFFDPSLADPAAEAIFGTPVTTFIEAICVLRRLLEEHPKKARVACIGMGVALGAITGMHVIAATPEAIELLVLALAGQYCSDSKTSSS